MAAKGKISKRMTKYLIYIVMASFVLGGLFTNYGMPEQTQENEEADTAYNIIQYDSERIASNTVECEITEKKNNIKLVMSQDSRITNEDLQQVFETNVTGVKSVLLEISQSNAMFDIQVEDEEVKAELEEEIKLDGARFYDIYTCTKENNFYSPF